MVIIEHTRKTGRLTTRALLAGQKRKGTWKYYRRRKKRENVRWSPIARHDSFTANVFEWTGVPKKITPYADTKILTKGIEKKNRDFQRQGTLYSRKRNDGKIHRDGLVQLVIYGLRQPIPVIPFFFFKVSMIKKYIVSFVKLLINRNGRMRISV